MARNGGDEFVVVTDDVSVLEVEQIAVRILKALTAPFSLGSQEISISASIGIALADRNSTPVSFCATQSSPCTGPMSAGADRSSCSTRY